MQMLEFCHGVAQGVAYLASRRFVHRDIACRNILLTLPGYEPKVMQCNDLPLQWTHRHRHTHTHTHTHYSDILFILPRVLVHPQGWRFRSFPSRRCQGLLPQDNRGHVARAVDGSGGSCPQLLHDKERRLESRCLVLGGVYVLRDPLLHNV